MEGERGDEGERGGGSSRLLGLSIFFQPVTLVRVQLTRFKNLNSPSKDWHLRITDKSKGRKLPTLMRGYGTERHHKAWLMGHGVVSSLLNIAE